MRLSILSVILVLALGCNSSIETHSQLSDIPVFSPDELIRFDVIGDYYLSHIGYTSVVLNDENVLIPDRQHSMIFKVNSSGELIDVIAGPGRGPGELQDISFISQSAFGDILVYDQMNQKVVILDSLGNFNRELIIPPRGASGSLIELYELKEKKYLLIYQSYEYLFDGESEQVSNLVIYDSDQEAFSNSKTISSRPSAVITGGGAGRKVPYAPADLLTYNKNTADLYLFWSGGHEIAQTDISLDTLHLISLDLEAELLTTAEIDTIRKAYPEYWDSMQALLPEHKALADQIIIDHQNNFWLKLNHVSDFQKWLVVSEQAELLKIVQLPKDVMLTHVSGDHLGVRLDDGTFSLFEPLNW